MAQEIELKLRVDRKSVPSISRKLAALGATRSRAVTLTNTYFDTPDLALQQRKIALRLRKLGRAWLQTVKTAGASVQGLTTRNEWETPYTGAFDFSSVDDPALRTLLESRLTELTPLFTTNFKRIRWLIDFHDARIEVALDDGAIEVGAYSEPIHELELELLSGPPHALEALRESLASVAHLAPEDASKAERGFRLRQSGVTGASSRRAKVRASETNTEATFPRMDLLLWRHAEAEEGSPDETRALTARGEKQARRMARWLAANQPRKLQVIVSPAKRALQTASAFTKDFKIDRRLAPGANVADVLAATNWPQASGAVLVVGHQPTLGQIAALLLGDVDASWGIKKGALWWFSNRMRDGETQTVLRAVICPAFLGED